MAGSALSRPGKACESSEILTPQRVLYEDLARQSSSSPYTSTTMRHGALSYANADNPPMVWRSDAQTCEWLDAEGLILGVKRTIVYERKQVQLHPGDILLLYTDGITEATNPDKEMFGEDRLCSLLKAYHTLPPHQIIEALFKKLRSFAGDQVLTDDISLVVMKLERQQAS
jgi:sigma-B regulation protein RsbU (phosphoserine phosphatase)